MRWILAGASGFLGGALRTALIRDGHLVTRLVRRPPRSIDESTWDPEKGEIDHRLLAQADVVVNLAGVGIARIPWTRGHAQQVLDSRVQSTRTLASALARLDRPPTYVAQSATGFYGKDREGVLDEDSSPGTGFLADVVREWEAATLPAEEAGVRVIRLRTGVVLDRSGGAFPLLAVPFRLGVGGRFGSGRQVLPAVSLPDWLRAVRFVTDDADCSGPYNVVARRPPTNAELTQALGRALGRPTLVTVPAFLMRLALGEFASELLGSADVRPRRLTERGFEFLAPDVDALVRSALGR